MSLIVNLYKKNLFVRYDFDPAIPYYEAKDFNKLRFEEKTFLNNHGNEIHFFKYSYHPIKNNKTIIFLAGIGPGHRAYLREINEFAMQGYEVITLDYEGCGYSQGNCMSSINQPTLDTLALLSYLNLKNEVILVGHSLGAYTALNVINKVNTIHKAVIMSGFLNEKYMMKSVLKSSLLASKITKYEKSLNPNLVIDNFSYLKQTSNNILFVHSKDDPTAKYKYLIPKVKKIKNPYLSFLEVNGKRHNPNYTFEAVKYKDQIIETYFKKVNKGKFNSDEERKEYFKDVKLEDLTTQDNEVLKKIFIYIG